MAQKASTSTGKMKTPVAKGKQKTNVPTYRHRTALRHHTSLSNLSDNMYELPLTASEAARRDRELARFFDFSRVGGAEPEPDFEEGDQQDVDGYAFYRYHPGGNDEDLNALRINPATRIPVVSQWEDPNHASRTQMAGESIPVAPPTGQHLSAPAALSQTPTHNAPQMQGAPTSMAPRQILPAPSTRPPFGGNPRDYLTTLHVGTPAQGVAWPANIEIGIIEICTFCPNWFMLPELVARAVRNEWTREALSKAQLHAQGTLSWDAWQTSIGRIQKQISSGCRMIDGIPSEDRYRHNSQEFRERHGQQDDLTASAWRFKAEYEAGKPVQTGHIPLSLMYMGVVNWPVGNDRLLMTQCLEFARNNAQLNLDTSHWDWIIQSQGLTAPPAPAGLSRDVDAFQRLNSNIADP